MSSFVIFTFVLCLQLSSMLSPTDTLAPAAENSVVTLFETARLAYDNGDNIEGEIQLHECMSPIINDHHEYITAVRLYMATLAQIATDVTRCRASCLKDYIRARPLTSTSSLRSQETFEEALGFVVTQQCNDCDNDGCNFTVVGCSVSGSLTTCLAASQLWHICGINCLSSIFVVAMPAVRHCMHRC